MKPIGIIIWTEKLDNLLSFYETILNSKVHKHKKTSAYFIYNDFRIYISEHSEITGDSKDIVIETSDEWSKYLSEKGYVGINGCSITIVKINDSRFQIHLGLHTVSYTHLTLPTNREV